MLSTLFCRPVPQPGTPLAIFGEGDNPADIPLIAVLRDTLGNSSPENDRLTYLWLLTYERPDLAQRVLSAVPFFYWRINDGPKGVNQTNTHPFLNLAAPEHAMLSDLSRDLLQWMALDPSVMAVRATSRMYRTNAMDYERLKIEEAISYLRQAPPGEGGVGLTPRQIATVVARLDLRRKLLGGFVTERQATRLGERAGLEQEQTRIRNWELLRQSAERAGLIFEPLNVGATTGQYAMLWFPLSEPRRPSGSSLSAVWKLLNIRNPWDDGRFQHFTGRIFLRQVDSSGALLPEGAAADHTVQLAALAVYSLNYARTPLLMMDFRDDQHQRLHEMTQRSINEVTAGVIGISHFTNWYYYVGADLYDFYAGRHGAAVDQASRLDCYSQFRVELSVDSHLDPTLRKQIRDHMESIQINPLETDPHHSIAAAWARYAQLEEDARPNGPLLARIERDRRQELAGFRETRGGIARDTALHELSLGLYTHRAKAAAGEIETLEAYRRAQYELGFLDSVVSAGTAPEVAYEPSRIQASVSQLTTLLPDLKSAAIRSHAAGTLSKLRQLSVDTGVQANCDEALASIRPNLPPGGAGGPGGMPGIALEVSGSQRLHQQ